MQNVFTKNFRVQIWFDAPPDKILLGTISLCAQDEESAMRLARAHTSYCQSGTDNINWTLEERGRLYICLGKAV